VRGKVKILSIGGGIKRRFLLRGPCGVVYRRGNGGDVGLTLVPEQCSLRFLQPGGHLVRLQLETAQKLAIAEVLRGIELAVQPRLLKQQALISAL